MTTPSATARMKRSLAPLAGLVLLVSLLSVGTSIILFTLVSSALQSVDSVFGSRVSVTSATTKTAKQPQAQQLHHKSSSSLRYKQQRLAILLPFVGQSTADIPAYLELFCTGVVGLASVADVLLVHNGVLNTIQQQQQHSKHACTTATNVKLINLQSTHAMMELFVSKLLNQVPATDWAIPPTQFVNFLAHHTNLLPYTLVEYKPALGHILSDYIPVETYSHWAYSDLDILWGDLGRHLTTASDWNDFDIITFTFGDQKRLYLRGQLTMHRNDPHKMIE